MNLTRVYATALAVLIAPPRRRDERGDVPGWVLVTLMSVVLIGAITAVAEPQLKSMVRNALNSVR